MSPQTAPADREGSPRPSKMDQILSAAREEFMRDGYEKTSMNAICRRAQVSKATLYAYFPAKQRLFSAIMARATQAFTAQVRRIADSGSRDCRAMLVAIGHQYLNLLRSTESITLFRIIIAEAPRFPHLGRTLLEESRVEIFEILGHVLRQFPRLESACPPHLEKIVSLFLALVRGDLHLRMLLDADFSLEEGQILAHVAGAVDAFLKAADLQASDVAAASS